MGRIRTQPELHVHGGGSALQNAEGLHNGRRHAVLRLVDLEVLEGTLRLGAPVLVAGHLDLAKGIAFCAGGSHSGGGCELATLRGLLCLQLSVARGCGESSSPGGSRPISGHDGRANFGMCQGRAQAGLGCAGGQRSSIHGGSRQRWNSRGRGVCNGLTDATIALKNFFNSPDSSKLKLGPGQFGGTRT